MAVIHKTTLTPTKLELLASWLPAQPWYRGAGRAPDLARAGGFRLDDPRGEVGLEFMVVADGPGDRPAAYHVPLTYRGAPLAGADGALIGTAEHGVLGRRWIYDGAHDPVLVAQLLALLQGQAEAQAQSLSDTSDPSVTAFFAGAAAAAAGSTTVVTGSQNTDVVSTGGPAERWTIQIIRALSPDQQADAVDAPTVRGHVTAEWSLPGGDRCRGAFAVLHDGAR